MYKMCLKELQSQNYEDKLSGLTSLENKNLGFYKDMDKPTGITSNGAGMISVSPSALEKEAA
jgi:hypothetical protein